MAVPPYTATEGRPPPGDVLAFPADVVGLNTGMSGELPNELRFIQVPFLPFGSVGLDAHEVIGDDRERVRRVRRVPAGVRDLELHVRDAGRVPVVVAVLGTGEWEV